MLAATSTTGLSESVPVAQTDLQWRSPELVQPMAWSQGLCTDVTTGVLYVSFLYISSSRRHRSCTFVVLTCFVCLPGFAYQFMPCCCGTPQAVRKVNRHLAKYGLYPTQDVLCPCCIPCQPDRTNEFGKSESVKGEVASGSWFCYVLCPPCYIQSNRGMFESKHFLPGMYATQVLSTVVS